MKFALVGVFAGRQVAQLVVADATDEATVAELGLANFDIVFVAIGDNLETSILTTLVLKEAGVKKVWVKARDKFHAKILQKVGADKVINPEWDMGRRVAQSMLDNRLFDYLELGHDMVLTEFVIGLHQAETFRVLVGEGVELQGGRIVQRAADPLAIAAPHGEPVRIVDLRVDGVAHAALVGAAAEHAGHRRDAQPFHPVAEEQRGADLDQA